LPFTPKKAYIARVDVLVELPKGLSLFDFIGIQQDLPELKRHILRIIERQKNK
jgi:hypothetical protein